MITFIVFNMWWGICGGSGNIMSNFTEQQMAIAFLILVASDLNLICSSLSK